MTAAPVDHPSPESSSSGRNSFGRARFSNVRGVRWRINLGVLPSSPSASIGDLRRVTADSRRSYASVRRQLLIDPHIAKDGNRSPDPSMDNPLSQNPDSTWGRFFRNAELEKIVDQDLSRLYPEDDQYFQSPACQVILRRVLLVWCLRHPECGYKQGMHELLAPLVYVLHVDLEYLSKVRGVYEEHFSDEFDAMDFDAVSNNRLTKSKSWDVDSNALDVHLNNEPKSCSIDDLDSDSMDLLLLSDPYGAEGELGIVLSEKFMEHDAYCMFDGLMSSVNGVVAMAEFFSASPSIGSFLGVPPVIEASSSLYFLLSIVDSSLHNHLVELGVEPQYFALRWLRVLFGREFSLGDLLAIWDELFSSSNISCSENDEYSFKVLCSARGAFIMAMAVSMLLHVRSSLLATENATSCLQRLLNFPRNLSLGKLIEKARSCQVLALKENIRVSSHAGFTQNRSLVATRGGSLSPKTPIQILPDSYWEEKWQVLHQEKVLQISHLRTNGKVNELLEGTLGLPWTKQCGYPIEDMEEKNGICSSVRHSSHDNFSHVVESLAVAVEQLSSVQESPPDEEANKCFSVDPCYIDVVRMSECVMEEPCLRTENSSVFSMNTVPNSETNDPEIESEISSITSSSFIGNVEDDNNHAPECRNAFDSPLPKGMEANAEVAKWEPSLDAKEKGESEVKMKKTLSGKFQWFWRSSKGTYTERSVEKVTPIEEGSSSEKKIGNVSFDDRPCSDGSRMEVVDRKMTGNLKKLGQSVLENIQVIESIMFRQEPGQGVLGGKEQETAMVALKELRMISNILSEM
ncbi:hypothetical protein HPP92_016785 [Vanilla planifolia]|uniref:Rab-GAP TBC domain-containing protein n=1 Tax=Vanilla planifolia TaxID=51239 RepID=A0A835UQT6_VANPL|nr:hypothetical protein HPP92_016785 [Vanilla planifolia]